MIHKLATLLVMVVAVGCSQGLNSAEPRGVSAVSHTLYLARHGQTAWNRVGRFQGDPDLDPVGYAQRVSLWMLMRSVKLGAIYTSERLRTQRTAALVARSHKLSIRVRAAINEIAPGILEGLCYAQVDPDHAEPEDQRCLVEPRDGHPPDAAVKFVARHWAELQARGHSAKVPLGESYLDMVQRARPFVSGELLAELVHGNVLVVGHGVINRVLLHLLTGWPLKSVQHIKQRNDQVFRLDGLGTARVVIRKYAPNTGWSGPCKAPVEGQHELVCG